MPATFNEVIGNHKLTGYNLSTHVTPERKRCAILCRGNPECYSFNFCGGRICELNSAAKGDDVSNSSWGFSEWCEYSGTPDDCLRRDPRYEICNRENCTLPSHRFHWDEWELTYEVSEENELLWRKVFVRNCLDSDNNVVLRSRCKGCHRNETNERVLWYFHFLMWNDSLSYCQQHNGTVFGQTGEPLNALLKKYVAINKAPFLVSQQFFRIGVHQDGSKTKWRSAESGQLVPDSQLLWCPCGQPNWPVGAYYIVVNPPDFAADIGFMYDIPDGRRKFMCSIKN